MGNERKRNAPKIIFSFHKNSIYRSTQQRNVEASMVRRYTSTASERNNKQKNVRKLKNGTNAMRKRKSDEGTEKLMYILAGK